MGVSACFLLAWWSTSPIQSPSAIVSKNKSDNTTSLILAAALILPIGFLNLLVFVHVIKESKAMAGSRHTKANSSHQLAMTVD